MKTKRLLTTIAVFLVMAAAAQAEDYGIYIYGTQVTSSNCDDLSTVRGVDEDTVYYQPSTNTLVIRDARLFLLTRMSASSSRNPPRLFLVGIETTVIFLC